jgi:hypothetical protein
VTGRAPKNLVASVRPAGYPRQRAVLHRVAESPTWVGMTTTGLKVAFADEASHRSTCILPRDARETAGRVIQSRANGPAT